MPGSPTRAVNENALALIPNKYRLAQILGIQFKKHLVYYLYRIPRVRRYKTFTIPKKTGGLRNISAPNTGLKVVQRRLLNLLNDIYTPRNGVHGFIKGRSILTNAEQHVGKRYVLNIDLKNFFESINFGRVRGIFKARPYLANDEVATVLAQICCHLDQLPQGAATSPMLSNMICARLDASLRELARQNKCTYTRYCDDITFSTNLSKFPEQLAVRMPDHFERSIVLGERLTEIISENGFEINEKKTRLLTRSDRQDVTGLVVNEFPNVPRKYVRNIRAALHAWQRYGREAFQEQYASRYFSGENKENAPDVRRVIQGRIQYVGWIRGFDDLLYIALRDKYNVLSDELQIPRNQETWEYRLENAIWVIEDEDSIIQGTAFFIENLGLVTCRHCVGGRPFIYHPSNPAARYPVRLLIQRDPPDLAILTVADGQNIENTWLSLDPSVNLRRQQPVTLAGYPNHAPGKQLRVQDGEIASFQVRSGVQKFNVSASIVAGNSGGPVLNKRRNVIGIAVTGADNETSADETDERGVIRIGMLLPLIAELNARRAPDVPIALEPVAN